MNNVRINNELNLTYPDGFSEMGETELVRYFGAAGNRWGVFNADQHIILSVSWTKAGFLSGDVETKLHELEARMRLSLLNYQRIHSFKMKIANQKAEGIRFEYRVKDSVRVHVADLILFKAKGKFYAVHYITRKVNAASARPAFQEALNSITLG